MNHLKIVSRIEIRNHRERESIVEWIFSSKGFWIIELSLIVDHAGYSLTVLRRWNVNLRHPLSLLNFNSPFSHPLSQPNTENSIETYHCHLRILVKTFFFSLLFQGRISDVLDLLLIQFVFFYSLKRRNVIESKRGSKRKTAKTNHRLNPPSQASFIDPFGESILFKTVLGIIVSVRLKSKQISFIYSKLLITMHENIITIYKKVLNCE